MGTKGPFGPVTATAGVATVGAPIPSKPGGSSVKTTSAPGVFAGWLVASTPPNATRRSDPDTEFQTAAACWIWLRTEAKSSFGAKPVGPLSATRKVSVLFGRAVRSNLSYTGVLGAPGTK